MRRDRVELKEQHRGHKHWLDILGEFGETRLKAPGQRIDKEQDQVRRDPDDDCQRQHPILDEFHNFRHTL